MNSKIGRAVYTYPNKGYFGVWALDMGSQGFGHCHWLKKGQAAVFSQLIINCLARMLTEHCRAM